MPFFYCHTFAVRHLKKNPLKEYYRFAGKILITFVSIQEMLEEKQQELSIHANEHKKEKKYNLLFFEKLLNDPQKIIFFSYIDSVL